jgi:hypothetical protein
MNRRTFLTTLATALPAATLVRHAHALAVDDLAASPRTLLAVGEAALPSELGQAGVAAAVSDFQRWIAGYREKAELVHGYGTSTIAWSGPTPATRWMSQLDALDVAARRAGARSFAALPLDRRRAMLRAELDAVKAASIPGNVGRAPHVALALLAHWYAGADATDRAYRARIAKQNCRPLATSGRKPLPIAGNRA